MKNKIIIVTAVFFLSYIFTNSAQAQQRLLPGFNPDRIIEDFVFSNTKTFSGPEAIQKFLEGKNSVLANTNADFLVKLKEASSNSAKETLEDPRPNLSRLRTAAELIWDASQSSGLNPQVILVTLNKEQSLITGHQSSAPERLQRSLDFAMGFGCPDNQPCGEIYRGFYAQLFGGFDTENNRYLGATKSLMRSFNTPGGRGPAVNGTVAKVGDTITLGNTVGDYEGVQPQQTIRLGNAATAALYRYTPHVFNGNYNFWRFFSTWFKLADGILIKQKSKSAKIYMLQNGQRFEVLPFVAEARNLRLKDATIMSKLEINSYPLSKEPLGLPDNTLVKQDGELFVFINNERRPVLEVVAKARNLSATQALNMSTAEAKLFKLGSPLPLPDGLIVKSTSDPAIYLNAGGKLRLFTDFTFKQRGVGQKIEELSDRDLKLFSKEGYVFPNDGTLVKASGSNTVFVFEGGQKRPIAGDAFMARGYQFSQVIELPQAELDLYATGSLITIGANSPVTSAVSTTPATPANPAFKEGALIKSKGAPTVYLIEGGQKRALSGEVFAARRFNFANIVELSATEVNAYPSGPVATVAPAVSATSTTSNPPAKLPPNMTFFSNNKTGEFYVFMNGVKRIIFSFVAKQKNMTPDIQYEDAYVQSLPSGNPVAPRDGTIMKGDKSTAIYIVEKALLRPLTFAAYQARKITPTQIQVQPQLEIDAYSKGATITK